VTAPDRVTMETRLATTANTTLSFRIAFKFFHIDVELVEAVEIVERNPRFSKSSLNCLHYPYCLHV
jgi:hypothetical protein